MSKTSKNDSWKLALLEVGVLILIVLMAAFVRYTNLETNPGWYSDEGMLIDIANHIDQGAAQYMALKGPLLMVGRPPLFIHLLAFIFRFTGAGILPLRALSATLGILSIVLLYTLVRVCLGREGILLAFLAAAVMTLSPMAILYSRVAYSYSLLTPLVLLCIMAAWKYSQTGSRGWLVIAALMVGIGTLTDLIAFTLLAPLLIVVLARRWKDVFLAILIGLSPFVIYIAILLIIQPHETLVDLGYLITRMKGFSIAAMIPAWIMNYGALLDHDSWIFPAMIGMFLIKPIRLRQILILFWALPVLLMARSIIIAGLGYYYVSPFLPLIALGVAAVPYYGIPRIRETIVGGFQVLTQRWHSRIKATTMKRVEIWNRVLSGLVIACIVFFPMFYYYLNSVFQLYTKFDTSLDWILVDPYSGEKAIQFVNTRVSPVDLVIASPTLAWALHARTADFQMPLVIDGIGTIHFPPGLDPSRFAYDTHLDSAKYVIMDPVWDNFGVKSIPEVAVMADTIQSQWRLVFRDGDVRIYENPMDVQ